MQNLNPFPIPFSEDQLKKIVQYIKDNLTGTQGDPIVLMIQSVVNEHAQKLAQAQAESSNQETKESEGSEINEN